MTMEYDKGQGDRARRKMALNGRLEGLAWALFFITIGVLWLLPEERVPESAWLVGVGTIMLGLNALRLLAGIRLSAFTIVVGAVALAAGLIGINGIDVSIFPILLILLGASLILKPWKLPDCGAMCFGGAARKESDSPQEKGDMSWTCE